MAKRGLALDQTLHARSQLPQEFKPYWEGMIAKRSDPLAPAETIPERLAMTRKTLGMSQRKLAELLGVDPGTWQVWEGGQT
jgi:DNA-binding transcriptional regulator YiaG